MSTLTELQARRAERKVHEDYPLSWTPRIVEAYETETCLLDNRIHAVLTAQLALAEPDNALPALVKWRDLLASCRADLVAKVMAGDKSGSVLTSIRVIDFGLRVLSADGMYFVEDLGYVLASLPLGKLLQERGHLPSETAKRPVSAAIPDDAPWLNWYGSLKDTERKIKQLTELRDQAQELLDRAMNDDDVATGRLPSVVAPTPQRKRRDDGSVFLRHPDGRIEEVSPATLTAAEVATGVNAV